MSGITERVCRITAVINKDFLPRSPVAIVSEFGVDVMGHMTGRAAMLGGEKGLFSRVFFRNERILSRPVDVIQFFVSMEEETRALQMVAEKFKLNIPGSGSVYSEAFTVLRNSGNVGVCTVQSESTERMRMQSQLMGICCIVLRGEGDLVARVALETGSCVPTVTFAHGAGLRDRLGLWRIAIPAEKEIVTMVVNSLEAEEIMNIIIDAARLDQPGRGFVYMFPVNRGLINMKVSSASRSEAASMEQVIMALDELKGGTEWRRRRLGGAQGEIRRKYLSNLSEFAFHCDEGESEEYLKVAMAAGASGATVSEYRYINSKGDTGVSPARVKCSMIVPSEKISELIVALENAGAFEVGMNNDAFSRNTFRAYSYSAMKQDR